MTANNSLHIARKFRFKAWSRRSFAAFNSLHIIVNIGRLSIRISDRIGKKVNSFLRRLLLPCFFHSEISVRDEAPPPLLSEAKLILSFFQCLILKRSLCTNVSDGEGKNCRYRLLLPITNRFPVVVLSGIPAFSAKHAYTFITEYRFIHAHNNFKLNYLINFCDHDN